MSRYLICQTENTEWLIDYVEEVYHRRPLREREDPFSLSDRLVSGVWHKFTSVKILQDGLPPRLSIKTPDLGPEQFGILSGDILRIARVDDLTEFEWSEPT
jgi:hypothetical protein